MNNNAGVDRDSSFACLIFYHSAKIQYIWVEMTTPKIKEHTRVLPHKFSYFLFATSPVSELVNANKNGHNCVEAKI